MAEPSDTFYIIEEGTVSVEASFVDIPLAQRAVTFPVNVALPNNGWCAFLHAYRSLRTWPQEQASHKVCTARSVGLLCGTEM